MAKLAIEIRKENMHFRTWNEDDGCPRVNTKKDFFQFTNLINAEFDKSDDFISEKANQKQTGNFV